MRRGNTSYCFIIPSKHIYLLLNYPVNSHESPYSERRRLKCKRCYSLVSAAPTNVAVRGSGEGRQRNIYKTGQTAVLRCVASSTMPVNYTWTYSNGALPANAIASSAVLQYAVDRTSLSSRDDRCPQSDFVITGLLT